MVEARGDDLIDRKKILVLESEKLLNASILSILASRPEFDVAQTPASSLACLEQCDNLQPDILILEEETMAMNILAVVKLTGRHPKMRLIVFRLSDTKVEVFDKQTIQVRQDADLFELL